MDFNVFSAGNLNGDIGEGTNVHKEGLIAPAYGRPDMNRSAKYATTEKETDTS